MGNGDANADTARSHSLDGSANLRRGFDVLMIRFPHLSDHRERGRKNMSTVRSESQTNLVETPAQEYPDRPLLVKLDQQTNQIVTHVDENNENEAVSDLSDRDERGVFFFSSTRSPRWSRRCLVKKMIDKQRSFRTSAKTSSIFFLSLQGIWKR